MTRAGVRLSRQSRIVVVGAIVVAAIAIAPGSASTTPPHGIPVASNGIRIECQLGHRPAVTRALRTAPVIRLSNRRHTARVHVAAFTFVAKLFVESGSPEFTSLSIRISQRTGAVIAAALYQGVTTNHYASHGFTGLHYAYTRRGAELQYFCRSRP